MATAMRILYFAQFFNLPDEPGGSRVYQLSRAWVSAGHDVTVVTGTVNDKSRTVAGKYRGRLVTEERVDGIRVLRTWVYSPSRGSYGKRYVNFVSYAASAGLAAALRGGRADLVYATSTPLTAVLPGHWNATARHIPWIFEVRDLWPESAVVAGVLKARSPVAQAADRLARQLYRRAARVVGVTRGIADGLVRQGVPASKVLMIPNGVDDWMVEGLDLLPRPEKSAGASAGDINIVYCGAHGPWNGLGQILDAAALLRDDERVRFTFIGDGEDRRKLEARAVSDGLGRVRFLGTLPKKEAFAHLAAASANIVVTWDHPFQRMVLANKIFDYLAAARPVVVAAEGEMAALVREAGAGLVVPPGRPEELAGAIRRMAAMSGAERDAMGRRGREYILARYRRAELAAELLRVFDQVLVETSGRARLA